MQLLLSDQHDLEIKKYPPTRFELTSWEPIEHGQSPINLVIETNQLGEITDKSRHNTECNDCPGVADKIFLFLHIYISVVYLVSKN